MDLILCHQTADFDALGAAVGLSRLIAGARIVLTGGAHPAVKDFLALHRDEFSLIERRSVNPKKIRSLIVADTQHLDRLGKAAEWFDLPHLSSIVLYDHHLDGDGDIPATERHIEAVGATTTMIVELLRKEGIKLHPVEATVMALGIHVDTGSLTYDQTTARDGYALAWLMEQGANVRTIAEYVEPSLSPELQKLLTIALENLEQVTVQGCRIASVLLETERFVPGLSNLAARVIDLTESEVLLLGHHYKRGQREEKDSTPGENRLTIIGRSRLEEINLNQLFEPFGGGGHSSAASLTLRGVDPQTTLKTLLERLIATIPHPLTARDLMSSPVRTIRPSTTIEQAQRILLRYGHSGLSVVDENDQLVGIISRRDLDLALHHGFSHAPVKGYMTRDIKVINPDTLLPEIESLMVTYDVGRLPVLQDDKLMGIVTRTDVLRQIHQHRQQTTDDKDKILSPPSCLLPSIRERLHSPIWNLLAKASAKAQEKGWHLYLVGGAVRDLLLAGDNESLLLQDIDLVVDGFHQSCDDRAGVELATLLQEIYPQSRLSIHGEFQTAALLWHKDPELGSLWVDIATARTEFYPYPAANPEVEASSIRQDLYRRDFTINALAIRLTSPREGELLDFFGGIFDLRSHLIRVLHPNSFIEDPTRIYRAVRFVVRLGFSLEAQTEEYIHYAIESGVYDRVSAENNVTPALTTRLKAELKYLFDAPYWKKALQLLASLGALRCLHYSLELTQDLWWQIRCVDRWLKMLDPQKKHPHWLMIVETIIAHLFPQYRGKVAENLALPKETVLRLQQLETIGKKIGELLPQCQSSSQIVMLLREYNPLALMLVAVKSDRSSRRVIWHYLAHLCKVKPLLTGNDLKQLGYKPGPIYSKILDSLLWATLDGKISNHTQAREFLTTIET
jgi:tRNA nucleotidyltransferase (CCA-adding enzyme)